MARANLGPRDGARMRALLPPEGGEVSAVGLGRGERWGSWVYAAVGRAILGFDLRAGVLLRHGVDARRQQRRRRRFGGER